MKSLREARERVSALRGHLVTDLNGQRRTVRPEHAPDQHEAGIELYGVLPDGTQVHRATIRSGALSASVLTLGATLAELMVPDADGHRGDVVLGFTDLEGWASEDNPCFNCIIGRTAGNSS